MDQNGSTLDFATSASHNSMTFQDGTPVQHSLPIWVDPSQSFTLQEHMEWLANHGVQSLLPNQNYFLSLQQSFSDTQGPITESQNAITQYAPSSELSTTTASCPSLVFSSAESPARSTQAFDNGAVADDSHEARPKSVDTMLESGTSSTESRPSSNNSSPMSRGPKFKVPTIKTHFGTKGEAVSISSASHNDGIQVAPDTDSMTAMSNEWMQIHDNSDQTSFYGQSLSAINAKPSPALLEPFQWQSPAMTRRTSVSSAVSGPVFSPYGTPTSGIWQQSMLNSPFAQQQMETPTSIINRYNGSPQSPHPPRNHTTWSRAQYLNALRQNRHGLKPSAMTVPNRIRPRAPRSAVEDYTFARNNFPSQHRSRTAEYRAKARVDNPDAMSVTTPQLALPPFQVATLYSSPDSSHAEFRAPTDIQTPPRNILPSSTQTPMGPPSGTPRANLTPNFNSLQMNTPYTCQQPFTPLPTGIQSSTPSSNPVPTPAHQPPLPIPSEPPLSDFLVNPASSSTSSSSPNHSHPPACGPIRQSPHFEGDIYTPRYKRRNAAGKWEGWCGYCQPGRWLDLKNSRYWEDKLRNHGICARTKTFFDGPLRVRWVSDRGTIWEGEAGDSGFDLAGKEGIEDDGVGRKREGLCGECNTWVGMDGMRSRGKGRCVAWWMHAYKCHEQSKSRQDGSGTLQ